MLAVLFNNCYIILLDFCTNLKMLFSLLFFGSSLFLSLYHPGNCKIPLSTTTLQISKWFALQSAKHCKISWTRLNTQVLHA